MAWPGCSSSQARATPGAFDPSISSSIGPAVLGDLTRARTWTSAAHSSLLVMVRMLSRTKSSELSSVWAIQARMYSGFLRISFSRRISDSTERGSPRPKMMSCGRW